jgi:hypothetical protein
VVVASLRLGATRKGGVCSIVRLVCGVYNGPLLLSGGRWNRGIYDNVAPSQPPRLHFKLRRWASALGQRCS